MLRFSEPEISALQMSPLEYLRQFNIAGYAIFDFAIAFLGIYLISGRLSKLFLKIRIDIPKRNWLFLTLPIAILTHLIFRVETPMTRDLLDPHGHYIIKAILLILLILGLMGIKVVKKK